MHWDCDLPGHRTRACSPHLPGNEFVFGDYIYMYIIYRYWNLCITGNGSYDIVHVLGIRYWVLCIRY